MASLMAGKLLHIVQTFRTGGMGLLLNFSQRVVDDLHIVHAAGGNRVEPACEIGHLRQQIRQRVVEVIDGGGAIGHMGTGLKLTHNAAHILAAADGPTVGTVQNGSGLQSHDTAHVVAQMVISHSALIAAAGQRAAGQTGNAADAGGNCLVRVIVENAGIDAA